MIIHAHIPAKSNLNPKARFVRSHALPAIVQADIHAPWGGVVPTLAMEAHAAAIDGVVDAALADAGVGLADLDAVAVTIGPGLSLCLRVPP
jgi:tRNA A37 threonylcarbamoyltransferase TsaD